MATDGKILVVDDNLDNRELLARMVEVLGFVPVLAENGHKALDCLDIEPFDIVLLDIMMPGMDGFETLTRIRERYDMQELPVLILSALSETKHIVKGLGLGANDYLTKPMTPRIVQKRIETQIRLKRMGDAQRQIMNTLQHANDINNRLMRIASHDLKNPLNNMAMVLSMLEPVIKGNPENEQILQMGFHYAEEMNNIISEFLDMEILHDAEIRIERTAFDVEETIMSVVNDYFPAAERKGIWLDATLYPATVHTDVARYKQALANLISNAIKYTPPGTTVQLKGSVKDRQYWLNVIDEGVGIPADEADKLFQPFGRLSVTPTGGEKSSGLGLWIVKQMMQLLDGDVGYNPETERGADFWVWVPLA